MDFEGGPFRPPGAASRRNGWFWIHRRGQIALEVRVHGLKTARALCRQLNGGGLKQRKKRRL
jgi:hypothetical protein